MVEAAVGGFDQQFHRQATLHGALQDYSSCHPLRVFPFAMSAAVFQPMPWVILKLPVFAREEVEQQAVVQAAVDHVALPLPADVVVMEAFPDPKRRIVFHDPGVDRVKSELAEQDRKSTRLNSSHQIISYAVFCLKKN